MIFSEYFLLLNLFSYFLLIIFLLLIFFLFPSFTQSNSVQGTKNHLSITEPTWHRMKPLEISRFSKSLVKEDLAMSSNAHIVIPRTPNLRSNVFYQQPIFQKYKWRFKFSKSYLYLLFHCDLVIPLGREGDLSSLRNYQGYQRNQLDFSILWYNRLSTFHFYMQSWGCISMSESIDQY